jgi:MFS family permease
MKSDTHIQKLTNRRVFVTLFFSTFASITGVGIVVPLLPVYAGNLGASGLYIGLIYGSFSLSRSFLLPYFGRRSDKVGRKPFIVAGLLGYALVSLAFIFFKSVNQLIVIRFFQGIASAMIMPVAQAYIGDVTPEGGEGLNMGMFNMSVFIGLRIGPILGGFIEEGLGLDAAFWCMGVLALIAFFMSLTMLPPVVVERGDVGARESASWRQLLSDRGIRGLFAFRFSYTTCIGIIWSFLPVYAHDAFSISSSRIGILVVLGVFVSGALQMPMGAVADRWNKTVMILIGGLIVACAIVSLKWVNGFGGIFLAMLIFGLGGGICSPAHMALAVISGNRSGAMGSVMALMTLAHSLGMMTGALLAGVIMDLSAVQNVFPLGAVVIVGGTVFCVMSVGRLGGQAARRPGG